jgi:uncharacterized coiled-coil protein SlyX
MAVLAGQREESYNHNEQMRKDLSVLSEVGIFLAGALAVGLLTGRRRAAPPATPAARTADEESPAIAALQRAVADMETRLAAQESTSAARFGHLEARLNEVPTTDQIVGAMEQLLARTMSSLDERLTTQAQSIEVLKGTVSQTDRLLERVLESLDSLQTYSEPLESTEDSLLHRKAV